MSKDSTSACSCCGYKWVTGLTGHHSCADHLLGRIKTLQETLAHEKRLWRTLKAESGYRTTTDFFGDSSFTVKELMERLELRGERTLD